MSRNQEKGIVENTVFSDEKTVFIELTIRELMGAQEMEKELFVLREQNMKLLEQNKQWAEYSAHIENENKSLKLQIETFLKNRFNLFGRMNKQTA